MALFKGDGAARVYGIWRDRGRGGAHRVRERGERGLRIGKAVAGRAVRRDREHERQWQLARAQDVRHRERHKGAKGVAEERERAGDVRDDLVGQSVGVGREGLEGGLGGARGAARRRHRPELDGLRQILGPVGVVGGAAACVRDAHEAQLHGGLALLDATQHVDRLSV